MTSLRAVAGRPIDTAALLDGFLARLEPRIEALHAGRFDAAEWADRQVTTDRRIELILPDGSRDSVVAVGVDATTGALRIADAAEPDGERSIVVGEIIHVRLAEL
jgi:biotin-(acetyl-CoA carboxylase) ligase